MYHSSKEKYVKVKTKEKLDSLETSYNVGV